MAQQATIAAHNLPQTTTQSSGPFIRQVIKASRPGFTHSGIAVTGSATDPLPQTPGFARGLHIKIVGSGGSNPATLTVALTTQATFDMAASTISFLVFKDPIGTPIIVGTGYRILSLAVLYGGQWGLFAAADQTALAGESAVQTGSGTAAGSGFTAYRYLPFEGTKGYGCIAMGNASALPTLQVNYNVAATFATNASTPMTAIAQTVDIDYYAVSNPGLEAPGNGSTFQWTEVPVANAVASASSMRIQLPRSAGWMHTLILHAVDASSIPVDIWGTRVQLFVDNQLVEDEDLQVRYRKMQVFTARGFTRPTGVLVYTWRDSLSQVGLGYLDSLETPPPITPGSLIELACWPFATFSGGPATVVAVYGMLVPRGAVQTGLPQA